LGHPRIFSEQEIPSGNPIEREKKRPLRAGKKEGQMNIRNLFLYIFCLIIVFSTISCKCDCDKTIAENISTYGDPDTKEDKLDIMKKRAKK